MNMLEYQKYRQTRSKQSSYDYISKLIRLMPSYIKKNAEYKTLPPNSILINKGELLKYVYITISGEITVVNEFESGKSYEPVVIYHSDFLGVVELIQNIPEVISTNLTSSDIEYIRIPLHYFSKWLEENHEITTLVLKSVSSNFVKNMFESGEGVLLDSMYLLVNHLLKKSIYNSSKSMYKLDETRDKTSKRTGINIRTLYRHVKKLKENHLISTYNRSIVFNEEQRKNLYDYYLQLRNK